MGVAACWLLAGRKIPQQVSIRLVWWVVLPILWACGGIAFVTRFTGGLGAMTNLSDTFPWGIWIAFDMLCGVALAAGGFLTAGAVYIFGLKKFYPILRPAILTAYLGYLMVLGGLLMDLGRPYNIWHPMIYWQHRSVMFELGWCVSLYNMVLTVEFLPLLLEKFRWHRLLRIVHSVTIPAVIAGCILSTLHQSSLGALFLIVPEKMWPLSYSPLLPLYFLISAVAVGLAMTIVESNLSARAFQRSLETPIILALGARDPAGHHSAADHPGHRYDRAGRMGLPAPAAVSDVHLPAAHGLAPDPDVHPAAPAVEAPAAHGVLGGALGGGGGHRQPSERGMVCACSPRPTTFMCPHGRKSRSRSAWFL